MRTNESPVLLNLIVYDNTTGQGEGETELGQRMIGTANRDRTGGGSAEKIWDEGSLSFTASLTLHPTLLSSLSSNLPTKSSRRLNWRRLFTLNKG